MLASNFSYLYNGVLHEKIASTCQKAEMEYIYGSFDLCAILCRQAAEFFTKWVFKEEILFPAPVWYTEFSTFADLLKSHEFRKAFRDVHLINDADKYLRIAGNDSVHDFDSETTVDDAYQSLQTLFAFVTRLYNIIYEDQYCDPFFEPYFYDESAMPLERDYAALIDEETDPEMRAKLALLKKCEDRSFDLAPFADLLPDESNIRRLTDALTDPKSLRKMLMQSSNQLRSLISNCYREFDYREVEAVIVYGIKACRKLVRISFKSIEQFRRGLT